VSCCQCVKNKSKKCLPVPNDDDNVDENIDLESDTEHEGVANSRSTLLKFLPQHPFAITHASRWLAAGKAQVPNFIGASIPWCDQGDHEYYCSTMLTLFKPWRTGLDLKNDEATWNDAFISHNFSDRQNSVMANMNICYESLDARDDFHAQMKKGTVSMPSWAEGASNIWTDLDQTITDDHLDSTNVNPIVSDVYISSTLGRAQLRAQTMMTSIRQTLSDAGWTKTDSQLLPSDLELKPEPIAVNKTAPQWKTAVLSACTCVLEERAQFLPQAPLQSKTKPNFVPNEVKIVDKSHLEKHCPPSKWQGSIDKIAKDFNLNVEQARAYRIVANHSCNNNAEQLKMNLAGMAGTGKTRVLKALIRLFKHKKEAHRLVVVAPTGSSASLLNGSTYHYMFAINTEGRKSSVVQLAQAKTRLQGVDYVFFDEVSMLSCRDLYLICARQAQLMNNPDTPFGGFNTIFSGDFAQLPPPIGGENASLYSRTVGINGQTMRSQEAAMGKALWHQVTTVVILRQNLRQSCQSYRDRQLQTALQNMRFKAYTSTDISFLNTLVSSRAKGRSHVSQKEFQNVSIITALNSQKDEINRLGCLRYAAETNQPLSHFMSQDTIPSSDDDQETRKASNRRRVQPCTKLSNILQAALWAQPPCRNSKQIPATLSLCIGMPIMIRRNAATELCITKGQEATVYALEYSKSPDGTQHLETLFLKLVNPSQTVQLPDLPANVVPLTRTTTHTSCQLIDDTSLTISRSQIEALPNFAMTDYASQGKTRERNVVDLGETRTHQGYYTALS
jgi:hypothetical protein